MGGNHTGKPVRARRSGFFYASTVALSLIGPGISSAMEAGPSNAIIEGFAQYQAGRVEQIVLNEFAHDIAKDDLSLRFFPKTAEAVTGYPGISGKRLLPLVREFFEDDTDTLQAIAQCYSDIGKQIKKDEKPTDAQIRAAWLAVQDLIAFVRYRIVSTEALVGDKPPNNSDAFLKQLESKFKVSGSGSVKCTIVTPGAQVALIDLTSVKAVGYRNLKDALEVAHREAVKLRATTPESAQKQKAKISDLDDPQFNAVLSALTELATALDGEKKSYTVYVHYLFKVLKAADVDSQVSAYYDFQNSALFLAGLLDAAKGGGTADTVEAVIRDFVDEEAAYNAKRLESTNFIRVHPFEKATCNYYWIFCRNSFFIGSFFGASAAHLDEDGDGRKSFEFRSYGPVGLEIKLASINGWPLTLTYAPIDIGAYITRELKDEDYSAKFSDIVAPSVAIGISAPVRPVTFLLGYQNGIRVGEDDETEAIFFSIAFDLPIFRLF